MQHDLNGQFAVVTGASTGLGVELARALLQHGADVAIVADDDMTSAVEELSDVGGDVLPIQLDLAEPEGVVRLHACLVELDRPVDVLALNTGVGLGGAFVDTSLRGDLRLIALNVTSTVHLAKLAIRQMVERGAGRVLVTASVASTMPGTYYATYAASKAFLLSFAEGLHHELTDTGVSVTALMPGPTDTEFFGQADMEDRRVADADQDDPADVARDAFDAMMAGRSHVVAGSMKNELEVVAGRLLPSSTREVDPVPVAR